MDIIYLEKPECKHDYNIGQKERFLLIELYFKGTYKML